MITQLIRMGSRSKKTVCLAATLVILSTCLATFISAQYEQPQDERDLDLTRRETAVSEKVQSQLEQVLTNYYAKDTFLINIKAYLERIPVKETSPKAKNNSNGTEEAAEEDTELPGLPIKPSDVQGSEIEKYVIEKWVFSDKYKIKYVDALVLLDDEKFLDKDIEFVKTVVKARAGIDETRGDMLAVNVISFPPPADAMKLVNQRVIDQAAEQRAGSVAESKDYTQYVYLGAAVFVFLLFIIILQSGSDKETLFI